MIGREKDVLPQAQNTLKHLSMKMVLRSIENLQT